MNLAEQAILQQIDTDELTRRVAMAHAWEAYLTGPKKQLKVRPGQPDDNVVVNYARMIVDKGVAFLFGKDIQLETDPDTDDTPEEAWLRGFWAYNGGMVTLQKLATNGGVCGHAFAKLVPAQPFPRLIVIDPAYVTVRTDPDDIDQVLWYVIAYTTTNPDTGKPQNVRQIIERMGAVWQITDEVSYGAGGWQTRADMPWPYAWPPIIDCQNLPLPNSYWGLADLEPDVLGLNDSIDFALSNLSRIIRYHAHPKTWGKGFVASEMSTAPDETIVLNNPLAELHNLEMISDLSSSLELYERLKDSIHETTNIPAISAGRMDNLGQLSGVALQILYQPLLEQTETKRRTYGRLVTEASRRAAALAGMGEDVRPEIVWPSMLPQNQLEERQTAMIDMQLGASRDTLLQKLGYNPADEATKRAQEQSETVGAQLLDLLQGGGDGGEL